MHFYLTQKEGRPLSADSSWGDPHIVEQNVASYAARSVDTRGRMHPEHGEADLYRTPFQQDRDRIIHSTAFRRLQYKTQVYVVHEGDFYRTRLTHSIEVMQRARTLARALGANEDLVEAISYAHDLGHPPFGHAGEETLNKLMGKQGFEHNFQSLRIVDELELRYTAFAGLNLCFETREGLARHSTPYDDPRLPAEFSDRRQPAIETQLVDIADQLAYCTHDLDDALTGGLLRAQDVVDSDIDIINEAYEVARREVRGTGAVGKLLAEKMLGRRLVRYLIERFSVDVIETTRRRIEDLGVETLADVTELDCPLVGLSDGAEKSFEQLRSLLLETVYHHPRVLRQVSKGRMILERLFEAFTRDPRMLHPVTRERWDAMKGSERRQRRILCDHLAGMTDRYAMDLYQSMFEPYEKVLHPGL